MITVILIAGLVVVLAWLGWRARTWRYNGPVEVRTGYAWPSRGDHDDHTGERLIQVTVRNSGRSPVQVASWGLATPGDGMITAIERIGSADPLPHVVAAGSEAQWFIRYSEVRLTCIERGYSMAQLRARVKLGNGKAVRAAHTGIGTPQ